MPAVPAEGQLPPGAGAGLVHVIECHGRRQTKNRYDEIGGVGREGPRAALAARVARPLASTVQCAGAVTDSVKVALRSGWSKQGKTFCAMSMPM